MSKPLEDPQQEKSWLPEAVRLEVRFDPEQTVELHAGDWCPQCHSARLDYDGLLNLGCPNCGYALGGCFT